MTALDLVFYASNALALTGWAALIAFPRTRFADRIATSLWPSFAIAALYTTLVLVTLVTGGSDGNFFSLDGIARLFTDRTVLTAAWIHYLAFDLAIGAWMFRRARGVSLPHRYLAPCLLATLWVGPLGFLAFRLVLGNRPL